MQEDAFVMPFLSRGAAVNNENYLKSIQSRFVPNFKMASMSSALIILNIVVFIVMHIVYQPSSYTQFLAWPKQMDKWLLDVELIKSNRIYMYQTVTAIFLHNNYIHILGNMIFATFVMYEMENSWRWAIPLGLLAGWAANCLAVLTIEGRALGFSGVLTSYVGMIVLLIVAHLAYFQSRARGAYCWLLVMAVFLTVAAIGFGGSVLVHLYGFVFGIVLAAAFYPKHPQSSITPTCHNIFKIVAIGLIVAVVVLAFIFA